MAIYRDLPPLVTEAIRRLPETGTPFPEAERLRWAQLMTMAFQWDYPTVAEPPDARALIKGGKLDEAELARRVAVRRDGAKADRASVLLAEWRSGQVTIPDPRDAALIDAADEPFVRRQAPPRANGGIIPPGRMVMIGEAGVTHPTAKAEEVPARMLEYGCFHCDERFGGDRAARDQHEGRCAYRPDSPERDEDIATGITITVQSNDPAAVPELVADTLEAASVRPVPLTEPGGAQDAEAAPKRPSAFPCQYCDLPFDSAQQRAGHKRWCKERPGAKAPPAHIDADGEAVPISVVPSDTVPQTIGQRQSARRAAEAAEADASRESFVESLRWKPPTEAESIPSFGHKRRPGDDEAVRAAGVDAAIARFGS